MSNETEKNFDATKIIEVATDNTVVNTYVDSFGIEKVLFLFASFKEPDKRISAYISFGDMETIVNEITTGRLFERIETSGNYGLTLAYGGTVESKRLNGAPESRVLSIRKASGSGVNASYYFNARASKGVLGDKGQFKPINEDVITVSVKMSTEDLIKLFTYSLAAVHAYLPEIVLKKVQIAKARREQH